MGRPTAPLLRLQVQDTNLLLQNLQMYQDAVQAHSYGQSSMKYRPFSAKSFKIVRQSSNEQMRWYWHRAYIDAHPTHCVAIHLRF